MKTESDFIGAGDDDQYADTSDSINDDEDVEIYFIDDDDVEVDEVMEDLLNRPSTDITDDDLDFVLDHLPPGLPAYCYDYDTGEIDEPMDPIQTFDIDPSMILTMVPIDELMDEDAMSSDDEINSDPRGNSTNVDDIEMTSDSNAIHTMQTGTPILREQSQNLMKDPSHNNNS